MIDFAIIIPCYNEELSIADVLNSLLNQIKKDFPQTIYKIYVYDNNSNDRTCETVKEYIYINKCNNIELRHAYKQGKGYVIRQAFQEINAKCYCIIDGDNTYDISNLKSMYELIIRQKADMVIGDRLSTSYFTENKRAFHNFGNKLVKNVINKLFHIHYKDILSGLRTFSYGYVKTFPITSGGFTLETEMNIHAAQHEMLVIDVPVKYRDRKEGSYSKLNTVSDGIKVICKIISMIRLYKPMLFYGIIALCLTLLGTGFSIPVFFEYFKTGEVLKFPTLIVCGFTIIAAILNLFMGILESSNNLRHKQIFEQTYINTITLYKMKEDN